MGSFWSVGSLNLAVPKVHVNWPNGIHNTQLLQPNPKHLMWHSMTHVSAALFSERRNCAEPLYPTNIKMGTSGKLAAIIRYTITTHNPKYQSG